jgi:hypothetical protein
MELWLDKFKDMISFNTYLFGHFHDDRVVQPGVQMLYYNIENLEDIYNRWTKEDDN